MKDPRFLLFGKSAAVMLGVFAAVCSVAAAQTTPPDPAPSSLDSGLLDLFLKSIDMFTVLLVLGSIVSVAVIIQCM
ncbi:MAG: hypothetical protein H7210_07460, partial [Pyrinomonadaceae bacterium]|nr:hypothetical protein [Phycisphaerales bacterium]